MYVLIMAGGYGKRFWPYSRDKNPKQFLSLFGKKSLLEETVSRILPLAGNEKIFIVTNNSHKRKTAELLSDIPKENIITEPIGRDTAACIGLGAVYIKNKDPEGVQVVLPADHLIENVSAFRKVIKNAVSLAQEKNCLVTIGIKPSYPNTGYGYIQYSEDKKERDSIYKVKAFAEKPNIETAQRFLASGDFLWNSGIFIWKADTILSEMEAFLPELHDGLMQINNSINKRNVAGIIKKVYSHIRNISIDYGIMEKAKDVYVIKADFGWSDVGNWAEVYRLGEKDDQENVTEGNVVLRESNGNLVLSSKKLLTGIGLKDMIIIDTNDVMLICPKSESQNVKELVDYIKRKGLREFL